MKDGTVLQTPAIIMADYYDESLHVFLCAEWTQ